jgi:hypothetical protein
MRLAARIAELRKDGLAIVTTKITRNGKTYAQYKATFPYVSTPQRA